MEERSREKQMVPELERQAVVSDSKRNQQHGKTYTRSFGRDIVRHAIYPQYFSVPQNLGREYIPTSLGYLRSRESDL
jgi:hypothetical protein